MGASQLLNPDASLWDWIAVDLRFWREREGLSLAQLGKRLQVSRQAVHNFEAGRRRLQDSHAQTLDALWNLNGHFQRLLKYARAGHDPSWFRQHFELESRATVLKIFELVTIPGILQTEEYARALFSAAGFRDVDVDVQVAARMARQEALSRSDPPLIWVLLDHSVLDRRIGGPQTMRAQLDQLLIAAKSPNIGVRIVPKESGAYLGLEGPIKIMTVDHANVVYTEATGGGRLYSDPGEVHAFEIRYDRIGAKALPEDQSLSLIRQTREVME